MPFNLRETIGGLNHLRLGWQRTLLSRPTDYYLRAAETLESFKTLVRPAKDENEQWCCAICGYALARLEIAGGWLFETCSATGLSPLLKSADFKIWHKAIPGVEAAGSPPELTSAGLPGPGL